MRILIAYSNDIHDMLSVVVVTQGCSVSLDTVGIIQAMTVKDPRGRALRLTVTSEVLGGSALRVEGGREEGGRKREGGREGGRERG